MFDVFHTWLRFTDEGSEGTWRDKWTNEQINFTSIPWKLSAEPTGLNVENCSGVKSGKKQPLIFCIL